MHLFKLPLHFLYIFVALTFVSEIIEVNKSYWKKGYVVFNSGKYFSGDIYQDIKYDVLLIREGTMTKAYPAYKVKKFQFYDEQLNINRQFISHFEESNKTTTPQFLEVVLKGGISLYRKSITSIDLNQEEAIHKTHFVYYAEVNDKLIELCKFKKDILPEILEKDSTNLIKFIEDKNLKFMN